MASIKVSTVIPTYNRPETTARAVRSALGQTKPPHEIFVIDDASAVPVSATTLGIEDPRLKIIRLEQNLGASGARQAGIDAATGDVIAFLDSDDQWLPAKLEIQLPMLENRLDEHIAVACGWAERGDRDWSRIPIGSSEPKDFASGCWFCPGSTVILPRAIFATVGPFDSALRRLEDLDWFLRFALIGGRVEVAPVVGASVSIGRRATSAYVGDARNRLKDRFRNLDAGMKRKLSAYLDLECASAARNEQKPVQMAYYLVRSFIASPRCQVPLRRWWETTKPVQKGA